MAAWLLAIWPQAEGGLPPKKSGRHGSLAAWLLIFSRRDRTTQISIVLAKSVYFCHNFFMRLIFVSFLTFAASGTDSQSFSFAGVGSYSGGSYSLSSFTQSGSDLSSMRNPLKQKSRQCPFSKDFFNAKTPSSKGRKDHCFSLRLSTFASLR